MFFLNAINNLLLDPIKAKGIIISIIFYLLVINLIIKSFFLYSKENKKRKFLNITCSFIFIIELIGIFILFYIDFKNSKNFSQEIPINILLLCMACIFYNSEILIRKEKKEIVLTETENDEDKLINLDEEEIIQAKLMKYKKNLKIIEVNGERYYLVPYRSYFDYNNIKELKVRILNDIELCFNNFINENYLDTMFLLFENEIDEKNNSLFWNSLKNKVLYVMILIVAYIKREELINEKGKSMSEISRTDSLAISKKIQTFDIDFIAKYFTNFRHDIFEKFLFFAGKIPNTCDKEIIGTNIKTENGLYFKYFDVNNELNKELIVLLKKQYPFDIDLIEKGLHPKIVGMIEEITTEYREHALYGIVCNIEIELKKLIEKYKK